MGERKEERRGGSVYFLFFYLLFPKKKTRKRRRKKRQLTGTRRQQEDELLAPLGVVRVDLRLAVLAAGVAVDAAVLVAAEEAVVLEDVEQAGHLCFEFFRKFGKFEV